MTVDLSSAQSGLATMKSGEVLHVQDIREEGEFYSLHLAGFGRCLYSREGRYLTKPENAESKPMLRPHRDIVHFEPN